MRSLLLPALLLCTALHAYEADLAKAKWEYSKYGKITERDGRRILRIEVPEGDKGAQGRNCVYVTVDVTPFRGKVMESSVMFRGENVKAVADWYPGVSFSFYCKDETTGQEDWPGIARVLHSFDWKEGAFSADIPMGAKTGILRMGLENATGIAEFDLTSLKIHTPDQLLKEPGAKLSPEARKELGVMKQRLRDSLLSRRAENAEKIKDNLAKQNPDGSFQGIDYKDGNRSVWLAAQHLNYTIELARAWAKPGHPCYRSKEVGEALKKAIDYWSKHAFQNSNWWWNDMSVPQKMSEILLMCDSLFPEGPEREAALDVCRQAMFLNRYTGNNRVFIAGNIFKRALLEENERALNAAADALSEEIRMAPPEYKSDWSFGGIRVDGSYQQHGPQLQFGNYGGEFFNNIAYWSNIWKGTRWQLSDEQWLVMRLLAFDGFQWVLWKGEMDILASGRQLGRDSSAGKGRRELSSFEILAQADPGGKTPYEAVLKRNRGGKNTLVGNRHFWTSDYMVHRRPEWFAAVRMNSVRTCPIEDNVNWDNALGRYLSDGVCLVYRSNEEYRDLTPCWDWTRLPGSTLPKTPIYTPEESKAVNLSSGGKTPRWTHSKRWRHLGSTAFTGGVTDGIHGVSVYTMDIDEVKAKKGYFFDTDAIYQLGSGIQSSSPFEVATTVNSCILSGEVKQDDGFFHHDGIGYRGKSLKLVTGEREGDWRYLEGGLQQPMPVKKNLFNLFIEHGLKPESASYEFAILPGATLNETAKWSKGRTLSNTGELQAVEFNDGTVGAIFYIPGKLGSFETASPGVFLIGKQTVWAADPTAQLKGMKLTLNGIEKTVELPNGEMAGSSIKTEF